MANIRLYRGNTPQGTGAWLCPGSGAFSPPFAAKIGAEYDRGAMAPSQGVFPKWSKQQRDLMVGAAVGDIVQLVVVPARHVVRGVALSLDPKFTMDTRCGGASACDQDTMAGVTFNVVAQVVEYNEETGEETVVSTTKPTNLQSIGADTAAWLFANLNDTAVNDGTVMIFGLELLSPPNNTELTFADMSGEITLTVHADDYDFGYNT